MSKHPKVRLPHHTSNTTCKQTLIMDWVKEVEKGLPPAASVNFYH